ncbi:MAG TPA: GNAT family N-acetyltransferase [Polyangiaceae bacterium]|jgi:ribosomal protein S18 acetylase RimI-like enzyme|nr:GNAT family N-acetyltransferase [Polyangiaceae bacterium]
MSLSIKRLGPGDEASLEILAREDADFDLEGRGQPLEPLKPVMAQRYLANPAVLHWVALDGEAIVGFLYCIHLPLRSGIGHEVLLYEIGVRQAYRRQGIGRTLLTHMENWMQTMGATEVWVAADNRVAVDFYRGSGFSAPSDQPVYMSREVERIPKKMVSTLLSPT